MENIRTIEGELSAAGLKFAIIAGRFNDFVVEHLISGAVDTIVRHGGKKNDIVLIRVPGSYEIPQVCRKIAEGGKFDAIVALGAVIRGHTPHFDFVAGEVAKGIAQVTMHNDTPVGFGIVTADNLEQAIERSGTKAGNKGSDAALAAMEMANVMKGLVKSKF